MSKYSKLTPYLTVKGAMDAIKFYEEAFDAEVEDVGMAPDGTRVLHAELEINDAIFYVADEFDDMPVGGGAKAPSTVGGASVTLHLALKKSKQVDRIMEQARAAGAEIIMPAQDMFWGARYGQVRDPFGHVWSFGAESKKKDRMKQFGEADSQDLGGKEFDRQHVDGQHVDGKEKHDKNDS